MGRRRRRRTDGILRQVTVREIIDFVPNKRFCYVATVANENDEEIGVSFVFRERGKSEESAQHWSIYFRKDGSFWLYEW